VPVVFIIADEIRQLLEDPWPAACGWNYLLWNLVYAKTGLIRQGPFFSAAVVEEVGSRGFENKENEHLAFAAYCAHITGICCGRNF
jgi:hypothetical protein